MKRIDLSTVAPDYEDRGVQRGCEKGYFFSIKDSRAVELFGICLGFLLGAELSNEADDFAHTRFEVCGAIT